MDPEREVAGALEHLGGCLTCQQRERRVKVFWRDGRASKSLLSLCVLRGCFKLQSQSPKKELAAKRGMTLYLTATTENDYLTVG